MPGQQAYPCCMGNDFGRHVAAALAARGVSIRAASKAMRYDHSYLSRVISGKQVPSAHFVQALDDYLNAGGTLVELAATTLDQDDRERVGRALASPGRIDRRTVEALADALTAQRKLDDVIGPAPLVAPVEQSMNMYLGVLRAARGLHRDSLAEVVAEHVQFTGWLYASSQLSYERAAHFLRDAGRMAREIESGPLLAQARNFRGYIARQQGMHYEVARWFELAYRTPGAHAAQRMGDAAQAAQGFALLGEVETARRLLGEAEGLADAARDVRPRTAYWLTGDFQRLNLGLAYAGMGDYASGADHLRAGLAGLPADQQSAVWASEYREALRDAADKS